MPIILGGDHSGVYDIASELDAQDRDIYRLEPAASESDRASDPSV